MSYALGLGRGRPKPAGIVALSGFVPTVEGWEPELEGRAPVAIGHGTLDPVISVGFARAARDLLHPELYREYDLSHAIDPRFLAELAPSIAARLQNPHL